MSPPPTSPAPTQARRPHIHLVSDATGETLKSVATAAMVQFHTSAQEVETHSWALVRTAAQMERVAESITKIGGLVLFTIVNPNLRDILVRHCVKHRIPYLAVLDPIILAMGKFFGEKAKNQPGRQHELDAEYFARIDAMHFTIAHDDGQHTDDIDKADIVLVGVSRTSKTPTSIYLANRGFKTANIPIVPGLTLPDELTRSKEPLVVGLTTSPDRLVMVRRNRLLSLNQTTETDYVDIEQVRAEVAEARKLCSRYGWPIIDVSRRSIEETAAAILNLYNRREEKLALSEDE